MRQLRAIWILAIALALLTAVPALAQGSRIAQVKTASGKVWIIRGKSKIAAKPGDPLYVSDVIETGPDGTIGFTFIDNTVFSTGPDTQLALQQFQFDSSNFHGRMLADLHKGTLTVVSGDITHSGPNAMRIKTPTAVLGVSGTTFAVLVY